ncbi:MAG: TatD family hydrolase [Fimbriimonadaceae bacterium]|nr:TatD family hydrolase [Fimbriimonadaceae bacterium]
MLVDTHTHLQFEAYAADRAAVVQRAVAAGVGRLVVIGCDLASSALAVELAAAWPGTVWAAVGVHPHEAASLDAAALTALRELAQRPGVVAIGECGLDWFRDRCPRPAQLAAFTAQQQLAVELGLPLVVHCREAHDDVYAALRAGNGFATRVVLHCYTTRPQTVARFVDAGCYVGTDGPLTYPRAEDAREVVRLVPRDRLLLETDCPFLAPQPYRGQRCEPAHLVAVNAALATVWGCDEAAAAAQTTANAAAFFGWE